MKPIIEVNGLWKEFYKGARQEKYLSLRDKFNSSIQYRKKKEKFWALTDVNFEVSPGESLAIIGKNGAGKSTLLKILSRITPPSRGEVILRGRLASLLEVGTGFHPELTGKENIYLNGSILGLGKKEILKQYDAIVDFSGVEAFLETPLKHYSSGMQLRLAFAVAAHLEPEILIIDEVLAVGDSAFQQKCINKMTEVSQSGRTILFVSHNMQAIKNLCTRGLLLEKGECVVKAEVNELVESYLSSSSSPKKYLDLRSVTDRRGALDLRFKSINLNKEKLEVGDKLVLHLELESIESKDLEFRDLDFGLTVNDKLGNTIHHFSNRFLDKTIDFHSKGNRYSFSFVNTLKPGNYDIRLFLRASEIIQDWLSLQNAFTVLESNIYGHGDSMGITSLVQCPFQFEIGG